MSCTITLLDTFNGRKISTHRSLIAAVRAQRKHLAVVRKANGHSSYITYGFVDKSGAPINDEAITETRIALDHAA